jgi:hypothetical protein
MVASFKSGVCWVFIYNHSDSPFFFEKLACRGEKDVSKGRTL